VKNLIGALAACIFLSGALGIIGAIECIKGHDYSVAAQHQVTAVGHLLNVPSRKGAYQYEFSVNGVKMVDSSDMCSTPLTLEACSNKGTVLVYYAYEPYPNSRLEDFASASAFAYRIGKPILAVCLPVFVLSVIAFAILLHTKMPKGGVIHIVPE
jgi:hypothetical protein